MTIYILDDDRIELAMWSGAITRSGLDIDLQLFCGCDSFKAAVFKNPPDACVVDFVMPFHPGTEVCKWIKELFPDVKVYICSGLVGEEYQLLAEACGATFISKKIPFNERLEVVYNGCRS